MVYLCLSVAGNLPASPVPGPQDEGQATHSQQEDQHDQVQHTRDQHDQVTPYERSA